MSNLDLLLTIGQIEDNYILVTTPQCNKRIPFTRAIALVAVVALLVTIVSFPVFGITIDPIYQTLYYFSPSLAQTLKPIQLSCVDNGIKLEVLSSAVYEDEIAFYVSLEDLTNQNRIDKTTDLFDSYHINRAFDSSASCSMLSYDPGSGVATFLITIRQWGDVNVGKEKITFFFTEFLSNKNVFKGDLTNEVLSNVSEVRETQKIESFRGGGGKDFDYESRFDLEYLIPTEDGIYFPVEGVTITNVGFIKGKLHIQIYYENIAMFDNHGYIRLEDMAGNQAECYSFSFWDDKKVGSFDEIIYDISPEELGNYKAYGEFVTCKNRTEGNWQVTFSLDDANK